MIEIINLNAETDIKSVTFDVKKSLEIGMKAEYFFENSGSYKTQLDILTVKNLGFFAMHTPRSVPTRTLQGSIELSI